MNTRFLTKLGACSDAVAWVDGQPDAATAWAACERGDWMLWLLCRLAGPPESDSRRTLVLAACACARLSLWCVRPGETRPLASIETAERWARKTGGVTLDMVRDAAYTAAAARAAYTPAPAAAAYAAAAYAAYTADADYTAEAPSRAAAFSAAAPARAAAAAAAYTAADYARAKTLKSCADIVRGFYPNAPVEVE